MTFVMRAPTTTEPSVKNVYFYRHHAEKHVCHVKTVRNVRRAKEHAVFLSFSLLLSNGQRECVSAGATLEQAIFIDEIKMICSWVVCALQWNMWNIPHVLVVTAWSCLLQRNNRKRKNQPIMTAKYAVIFLQ